MQFTLNLLFDQADLRVIRDAGENVQIAKPVNGAQTDVVWIAFDPFEANTVTWDEEYGLYVSNSSQEHGATIVKLSESGFPAASQTFYSLESDATFHGPADKSAPEGAYGVENKMPAAQYPALTFGLTQSAIVNGNRIEFKPLNAQPVPAMQNATFTPLTTLYVWLDEQLETSTMITHVYADQTKVVFGGAVTDQTLRYQNSAGRFVGQS